jgi:hypothetical protein
MSKDSTTKANVKKKGKTIKEKQTAKRQKRDAQNGHSSNIPPTGHWAQPGWGAGRSFAVEQIVAVRVDPTWIGVVTEVLPAVDGVRRYGVRDHRDDGRDYVSAGSAGRPVPGRWTVRSWRHVRGVSGPAAWLPGRSARRTAAKRHMSARKAAHSCLGGRRAAGADVQGMFSNDIVGASQAWDGTRPDPRTLRLFVEGIPTAATAAQISLMQSVGGKNDGAAPSELTGMNIRVIWRRDRYPPAGTALGSGRSARRRRTAWPRLDRAMGTDEPALRLGHQLPPDTRRVVRSWHDQPVLAVDRRCTDE